jgi:ubiquinone biosynthesis protein UbiJ
MQGRTVPLFQNQISRIFERLRKLRSKSTAPSQNSLAHTAEALEHVVEAVQAIDQRLQKLEKGDAPKSQV